MIDRLPSTLGGASSRNSVRGPLKTEAMEGRVQRDCAQADVKRFDPEAEPDGPDRHGLAFVRPDPRTRDPAYP